MSRLEENVAADQVELATEQIGRLEALPAPVGGHHTDEQMAVIER